MMYKIILFIGSLLFFISSTTIAYTQSSYLKLVADKDCNIYIDGEFKGFLKAGPKYMKKFALGQGEYVVLAQTKDEKYQEVFTINMWNQDRVKFLKLTDASANNDPYNSSTRPYTPSFGEFGAGDPGKQGAPTGKKDNLGKVGPRGNGTGLVGERRRCIRNGCSCELSPSDLDEITHRHTKVYVQVTISPSGDAEIISILKK